MDIITQVNREDEEEEDAQLNAYTNDKGKNCEFRRINFIIKKRC